MCAVQKGEYMTKTNGMKFKTKMNIFFIVLKLLLCIAIMASSTYALFTDNSEYSVYVKAGNMDVRLLSWAVDQGRYVDRGVDQDDVFDTELWEPGKTEAVFLKVENHSNIPIKFLLEMKSVEMNELEGAFVYCVYKGEREDLTGKSWAEISKDKKIYTLSDGTNPISDNRYEYLDNKSVDKDYGEAYYTLVLHMLEEGDNGYQDKTDINEACIVNFHLFAVQGNANVETAEASN